MAFNQDHQLLREHYQVEHDRGGTGFVARELLKRDGIDLEAWEREAELR